MSTVEEIRNLLGPADPARDTTPVPRLAAHELIAAAEQAADPHPALRHDPVPGTRRVPVHGGLRDPDLAVRRGPSRRTVLAAAGGALALATAGAVAAGVRRQRPVRVPSGLGHTPGGSPGDLWSSVMTLVAYEYPKHAGRAGDQLRRLADRLADAPYEGHTGRYAFHHITGVIALGGSADGRWQRAERGETWIWQDDDGNGRQSDRGLPPQYPDAATERWFAAQLTGAPQPTGTPAPHSYPLPPVPVPPFSLSGLRREIAERSAAGITKAVESLYRLYVLPREQRAQILRLLAGVAGFAWRGRVTDRAGRPGVAVTMDDPDSGQLLLIFDPGTGVLLGSELIRLEPVRISLYQVYLETDRTDQPG
jgi:hypothetical protein